MNVIMYLSDFIIPLLVFYIVGFGILMKKNIYEDFVRGAAEGFKTVIKIMPTLVGLMVAVGVLRESGFLGLVGECIGKMLSFLSFPGELIPMVIVRMFSSSAATGLLLDVFKEFGPDSSLGRLASVMMSCTETIFYTMSVYFMVAKVKKTRWTLAGALVSTLAGIVASFFLA